MGALSARGESATVPQPSISIEVHQSLDVHCDFLPEVTLNSMRGFEDTTDTSNLALREFLNSSVGIDASFRENFPGGLTTDSVNVGQPY
jgi:hypothetical protein